jgi:integrase
MRERSPGVFEVRVVVGRDPLTGNSVQRSFTVRGDTEHAEARRRELVADHGIDLSVLHASGLTVGELLTRWFAAGHAWKPSTRIGYDCDVRALCADPIANLRLCSLDLAAMHRVVGRWQATGVTVATVSSRTKALSSALRWAVEQGILRAHPLAGMRHPPVPLPRLPLPLDDVDRLLRAAAKQVAGARADRSGHAVFEAEQTELLVRLAADSGARRGELAALKIGDLEDRVLHICRNISGPSTVTTPKSHQYRSLTLGRATVELYRAHVARWPEKVRSGDWLFAPTPARVTFIQPRGLAARFERLRDFAGVPDAALHRLRHTVAVLLVAEGELLAAQHRLGHRDLSTTLRHYGWAQAPDDTAVADRLDRLLSGGLVTHALCR